MEEEKILKALYFIRNRQIIQSVESDATKTEYYQGYLYAIKNDMYPIFDADRDDREEIELYSDFYAIKKDVIETVTKEVDDLYKKKIYKNFDYWVDFFKEDCDADDLEKIFSYCKLSRRFIGYEDFWKVMDERKKNSVES